MPPPSRSSISALVLGEQIGVSAASPHLVKRLSRQACDLPSLVRHVEPARRTPEPHGARVLLVGYSDPGLPQTATDVVGLVVLSRWAAPCSCRPTSCRSSISRTSCATTTTSASPRAAHSRRSSRWQSALHLVSDPSRTATGSRQRTHVGRPARPVLVDCWPAGRAGRISVGRRGGVVPSGRSFEAVADL
jgi:hypothetical protein